MKTGINLATKKVVTKKKIGYSTFAVFFFGATFVLSFLLVGFSVFQRYTLSQLADEEVSVISSINQQNAKKIKYLALKERLASINNVLGTREDINTRLNSLIAIFPQDLIFNKLEVDKKKIVVGIETPSLQVMDILTAEKIPTFAKDSSSGIKTINFSNFESGMSAGSYFATFEFTYN